MFLKHFLFFILFNCISHGYQRKNEFCEFRLRTDIPLPTPLILKNQLAPEILYPDSSETIRVERGARIRLVCHGVGFNDSKIKSDYLTVSCYKKNLVRFRNRIKEFSHLNCTKYPKTDTRVISNRCHKKNPNALEIEIGFNLTNGFLRQFTVCFDNSTKNNIYSWYNVSHLNFAKKPHSYKMGYFKTDYFDFPVYRYYHWKQEIDTLSEILNSTDLGHKYVKNDSKSFLARGHVIPIADFVYGFEQAATMYFINVAPQWQQFNGGNWNQLEMMTRKLLGSRRGKNYLIASGTYGEAELRDKDGVQRHLYIYKNETNGETLKVPRIYWKLVYNNEERKGIVFVGVNNPYIKHVPKSYFFCKDLCETVNWVGYNLRNVRRGYLYCCESEEFFDSFGEVSFL